jgi:segregation and condensation protein B
MTAPDNDDHTPPPSPEPAATEEDGSSFEPPVSQWSVPDADGVELARPADLLGEPIAGDHAGAEPNGLAPARPDRGEARAVNGLAAGSGLGDESGEPEVPAELAGPPPGGADVWPTDEVLEAVELDDTAWTRRGLEAILLVADEPVPAATLAELVGARLTQVESMLIDLAGEYAGQGRGFVLRAVAGGWRLYTHPATHDVVEAYLRTGQQSRLTRAALETVAVIAYRQPVTRHQVAAVRGVNVDGVFRTLATRGLIHEVGHEEGPGQAALYGTTPAFLEQLGLTSLDQLPPIKDYLPEGVDLMELLEQM